ncbi:MAG: hypothetical protein IKT57_09720 [Clostridia bacterium]|nr:hypothetical protein [Clostridia bacterium]
MYLWTAADVSFSLAALRKEAQRHNHSLALSKTAFSLPQHISLKISCSVDDAHFVHACQDIVSLLSSQSPFEVQPGTISRHRNILWLTIQENNTLSSLHHQLDELLLRKYKVPQHPFDTCFQFHSTLFMDDNEIKLDQMLSLLSDFPLPPSLYIQDYLIGCSESGKPGTYRVIRQIHV